MKLKTSRYILTIFSLFFLMMTIIISGIIITNKSKQLIEPFTLGLLFILVFFLCLMIYQFLTIPILEYEENEIRYKTIFQKKFKPIIIESYFTLRYQSNNFELLYLKTLMGKKLKIDEQFYRNYSDLKPILIKGISFNEAAKKEKKALQFNIITKSILVLGILLILCSLFIKSIGSNFIKKIKENPLDINYLLLSFGLILLGLYFLLKYLNNRKAST
jgi:hypothetical protein